MSAPCTVILSAPTAWTAREGLERLLAQFNCEQVIDDWDPRTAHTPGALHLTTMRPEPLLRHLQFNKPWLVRHMQQRGWDEQRQRIADLRQQNTRSLIQGLAIVAFFILMLGIVGPAIDGAGDGILTVRRDSVSWTDKQGHEQHRNVITVLHRSTP